MKLLLLADEYPIYGGPNVPHAALRQVVAIFCDFWGGHRGALRRLDAAAATDPELEESLSARIAGNSSRVRAVSVPTISRHHPIKLALIEAAVEPDAGVIDQDVDALGDASQILPEVGGAAGSSRSRASQCTAVACAIPWRLVRLSLRAVRN